MDSDCCNFKHKTVKAVKCGNMLQDQPKHKITDTAWIEPWSDSSAEAWETSLEWPGSPRAAAVLAQPLGVSPASCARGCLQTRKDGPAHHLLKRLQVKVFQDIYFFLNKTNGYIYLEVWRETLEARLGGGQDLGETTGPWGRGTGGRDRRCEHWDFSWTQKHWPLFRWRMCQTRRDCSGANDKFPLTRPKERFRVSVRHTSPQQEGPLCPPAQLLARRHTCSCPKPQRGCPPRPLALWQPERLPTSAALVAGPWEDKQRMWGRPYSGQREPNLATASWHPCFHPKQKPSLSRPDSSVHRRPCGHPHGCEICTRRIREGGGNQVNQLREGRFFSLIKEITGQFYRGKVAAMFQGPTLDGKFGNISFV